MDEKLINQLEKELDKRIEDLGDSIKDEKDVQDNDTRNKEEELKELKEDKLKLEQLLKDRKKYKEQIEDNRKNNIKPNKKNNPSYQLYPINKQIEELLEKYEIEKIKMEEPENSEQRKTKEIKWHPELTQEQIDELIAEGIEPGDPEYTLSLYNYGIKPEKSAVKDGKKETDDVNRDRRELEYLKSLLDDPDLDSSDMPAQNRQEILNRIAELEEKLKDKEKSQVNEDKKEIKWHPELTQEQIDELIAEGIEPGDPEYTLSLYNYGIKPEKSAVKDGKKETDDVSRDRRELEYLKSLLDDPDLDSSDMPAQNRQEILNRIAELEEKLKDKEKSQVNEDKKEIKWHPELTQEQIDELIAEGIEPGDPEYTLSLYNYGIKPEKGNPENDNLGKDDSGKGNPGNDNLGEDDLEKKPKNNLPIRSFWEIYNDTCTQHVGSIANAINKVAHMKILPSRDEDTLQKVLNVGLIPFKAAMKIASFIPNKIMRTDRKVAEMQENIDELSVEDFQVLVQSPEKVNEMFGAHIKDTFDKDYLDSQFMKQYKVNNAYLDVVRARLGRERGSAISLYNQQAINAEARMQELDEVGEENWTPEQEIEYRNNVAIYQQCVAEGKKCQTELDAFDEGAKKKSSSYRNISGWLLAKFNPDNREQNAEMAELSKSRREAAQIGDGTRVSSITGRMQKKARENTELRGGRKNYIDIGAYSMEGPIEALDRGPQNKGRLLLSNVAIISSAMGLANQVKENIANRQMVEAHNQQLGQVNQANQNIQVSGQAKVAGSPSATQAQEAITRQTVNAGFNQAERANLEANGFSFGGNYHKNDITVHADATRAATDAENLLKQGDTLGALKAATGYYTKVQKDSQASAANYIASHPQHDYTAYSFGSTADMSKVVDFFVNGTVPYQTNVNGVLAGLMPSLKEGIDINAVIFAGANSLYQAQKEGTKDIRKQLRRAARRNNEEIQNEEPQNNNNEQNDRGNQEDGREDR